MSSRSLLPQPHVIRPVTCPHCGQVFVTAAVKRARCPHCKTWVSPRYLRHQDCILNDGIIEPSEDSPIGFTSDVFTGSLFKRGRDIWICLMSVYPSKQEQGHFTRLLALLTSAGYRVHVPCPSKHMMEILHKRGFRILKFCPYGACMNRRGEACTP